MASVILPILIGLGGHRRHIFYIKILVVSLLVSAITNLANEILVFGYQLNSTLVYHCYTVVEFYILALLYKHFFHSPRLKHTISIILIIFVIFKIFDVTLITGIRNYDTLAMTLESVLMITFGLVYFDQVLREMKIPNLEKHPMFWINSGILIYFSGSLFLFLFGHFIFSSQISYRNFWSIHSILTITKHTLFSIGLWFQK